MCNVHACLQDSLRESRAGKRAAARAELQAPGKRQRRRRAPRNSDSDEDEFFDRTIAKPRDVSDAKATHTVETLCVRRQEHAAAAAVIEAQIQKVTVPLMFNCYAHNACLAVLVCAQDIMCMSVP